MQFLVPDQRAATKGRLTRSREFPCSVEGVLLCCRRPSGMGQSHYSPTGVYIAVGQTVIDFCYDAT